MSDIIRRGTDFLGRETDARIKISAEAENLLRMRPEFCTSEDVGNLIHRMTKIEQANVREIELLVNGDGNLQLYVRLNTPTGEMKINDLSFERTANGWEYRGKNFR